MVFEREITQEQAQCLRHFANLLHYWKEVGRWGGGATWGTGMEMILKVPEGWGEQDWRSYLTILLFKHCRFARAGRGNEWRRF